MMTSPMALNSTNDSCRPKQSINLNIDFFNDLDKLKHDLSKKFNSDDKIYQY